MQPSAKDNGTSYKIALALLVGLFLIGMAATILTASRRASPVVDSDYYLNGLHYDQTRSGAKNPGLGWSMAASLAGGELLVRVSDGAGAPVAGGRLCFVPKKSDAGGTLALAESAPGLYRAPRPTAGDGELHGTLRFSHGEASASQRLVLFN